MEIEEIYKKIDAIGCLTFATIENGYPETRIAHFFAYDKDGIYMRTMDVKPLYRQLKKTGRLSCCGMYPKTQVEHDEEGLPHFLPGYTLRVTGDVRELSMEEIESKAVLNDAFYVATFDIKKYPETRVFVMYKAWGEIYDYDYEWQNRDHKLERERFAWGGAEYEEPGLSITDACIKCGACKSVCTFDAIKLKSDDSQYEILGNRCDECGNCFNICPVHAVIDKGHYRR